MTSKGVAASPALNRWIPSVSLAVALLVTFLASLALARYQLIFEQLQMKELPAWVESPLKFASLVRSREFAFLGLGGLLGFWIILHLRSARQARLLAHGFNAFALVLLALFLGIVVWFGSGPLLPVRPHVGFSP